jgi:hypothetical protein
LLRRILAIFTATSTGTQIRVSMCLIHSFRNIILSLFICCLSYFFLS